MVKISPPAPLESNRVGPGHLGEIDDTGVGRPQGLDARNVGFDLLEAVRADHLQPLDAVGHTALVELLQPAKLRGVGGYDHLATPLVFDPVSLAEAKQRLDPLDTKPGLLRVGPVVDAGMDYAAVVACLMGGHLGFLLHHCDPPAGIPPA